MARRSDIFLRLFNGLRGGEAPSVRATPQMECQDESAMTRHLWRYRQLADRTGRGFATVLFAAQDPATHATLLRVLRQRCRLTDEFGATPRHVCETEGWNKLRPRCVLVLLPETSGPGARRFSEDVGGRFPTGRRPMVRVGIYQPRDLSDPSDSSDDEQPPREPGDRPARGLGLRTQPTDLRLAGSVDAAAVPRLNAIIFARTMPWWKRGLDLLVSGSGLVALAPLMGLVVLIVRIDSQGPGLYRQKRAGLGGRAFEMLKFRTMVVGADQRQAALRSASKQDGPAFKLRRDPRVTRVGLLLRATSLDELPQLWNVFRGHMTLVGPRPLPVQESDQCQPWQRARLDVTPGLTCIWQVHGRSRVSFDDWMRMDLRYVRKRVGRWAAVHDLVLLAKTAPAIFLKHGF